MAFVVKCACGKENCNGYHFPPPEFYDWFWVWLKYWWSGDIRDWPRIGPGPKNVDILKHLQVVAHEKDLKGYLSAGWSVKFQLKDSSEFLLEKTVNIQKVANQAFTQLQPQLEKTFNALLEQEFAVKPVM